MSSSAASAISDGHKQRRPGVNRSDESVEPGANSEDKSFAVRQILRPSLARHWTTFQDHADAIRPKTLRDDVSSPRPEDRREGFTWEAPKHVDLTDDNSRTTSRAPVGRLSDPRDAASRTVNSQISSNRPSSTSTFRGVLSRHSTDTSFSSFRRNRRRHVPDLRIFSSVKIKREKSEEKGEKEESVKGSIKDATKSSKKARTLSFQPSSAMKKLAIEGKGTKHVQLEDRPDNPRGGLKDRRNIANVDSMKLNLPLQLPDLPPRQRTPVSEEHLRALAPLRPRSPKTPWIKDNPGAWLPSDPASALHLNLQTPENRSAHGLLPGSDLIESSIQLKESEKQDGLRDTTSRSKFRRLRGRKSEASSTSTEHEAKMNEELKQLGNKRSKRWRWSGPWTSNDIASADSPSNDPPTPRTPFLRTMNPFKGHSNSSPNASMLGLGSPIFGRRKASIYRPPNSLENMSVPPIFVPPGVQRVPTPPMYDQNGDLKDKLTTFFFDPQYKKRPRSSPEGYWDSDVLLMSQETTITSSSGSSNEPPPRSPAPDTALSDRIPESGEPSDWFRVRMNGKEKDHTIQEAEEKAKFEWLTPEHLPGSPLCPLSENYRGPIKGMCVYHGCNQGVSRATVSPAVERELVNSGYSMRRLVSLSSP